MAKVLSKLASPFRSFWSQVRRNAQQIEIRQRRKRYNQVTEMLKKPETRSQAELFESDLRSVLQVINEYIRSAKKHNNPELLKKDEALRDTMLDAIGKINKRWMKKEEFTEFYRLMRELKIAWLRRAEQESPPAKRLKAVLTLERKIDELKQLGQSLRKPFVKAVRKAQEQEKPK